MPAGLSRRAQTTKQAKADFKSRGATYVSPAEKKRLERGAELLARAKRIKAQEAKKKEWQEKKSKEQGKQNEDPNLSSQRRLDKFGYASSQFHLGKFFKSATTTKTDDSALTSHAAPEETDELSKDATPEATPPTSPVDMTMFLDTSTQIARDIAEKEPPSAPVQNHISPVASRQQPTGFPSFSSDFDDETIAELDTVVEQLEFRRSLSPVKSQSPATSPKPNMNFKANSNSGKQMMPPPMLPPPRPALAAKPKNGLARPPPPKPAFSKPMLPPPKPALPQKRSHASPGTSSYTRKKPSPDFSIFGWSNADLDDLANDDIILSQMPAR